MEQFKSCERDSKTRLFSKEGQAIPTDSEEKKEARTWIQKSLRELQTQIDQYETELEQIILGTHFKHIF
jgi:CCR4-NOT transcription complex subunit 3